MAEDVVIITKIIISTNINIRPIAVTIIHIKK
jgi:hypothetical protein